MTCQTVNWIFFLMSILHNIYGTFLFYCIDQFYLIVMSHCLVGFLRFFSENASACLEKLIGVN